MTVKRLNKRRGGRGVCARGRYPWMLRVWGKREIRYCTSVRRSARDGRMQFSPADNYRINAEIRCNESRKSENSRVSARTEKPRPFLTSIFRSCISRWSLSLTSWRGTYSNSQRRNLRKYFNENYDFVYLMHLASNARYAKGPVASFSLLSEIRETTFRVHPIPITPMKLVTITSVLLRRASCLITSRRGNDTAVFVTIRWSHRLFKSRSGVTSRFCINEKTAVNLYKGFSSWNNYFINLVVCTCAVFAV